MCLDILESPSLSLHHHDNISSCSSIWFLHKILAILDIFLGVCGAWDSIMNAYYSMFTWPIRVLGK